MVVTEINNGLKFRNVFCGRLWSSQQVLFSLQRSNHILILAIVIILIMYSVFSVCTLTQPDGNSLGGFPPGGGPALYLSGKAENAR